MAQLYLCVSQTENHIPYEFSLTGVRVYSLEEALYHCLHNWRQTMEDFISAPFIRWVESLGLISIAQKIRELEAMENFTMSFMAFLSLTDFLSQEDLAALHRELTLWERRGAWEKLKEQGDFWLAREFGERAYGFYAKALKYNENVALLNNAATALLHMGDAPAAVGYFARALILEPKNLKLHFNHIEAMVMAGSYTAAQAAINQAANLTEQKHPELLYFQGEIQFNQKNYLEAAKFYNTALDLHYDPDYLYRLSDCYMRIRQFDKAFEALERIKEEDQDLKFLKKQAEHQAASGNLPAAIKSLEKAVLAENLGAELWTIKAAYHRQDYNLVRAQGSITRALTLEPDNPAILLESARIRKAQGRTKDYQDILNKILEQFKKDYRKMS